jgi:hypothetical protein
MISPLLSGIIVIEVVDDELLLLNKATAIFAHFVFRKWFIAMWTQKLEFDFHLLEEPLTVIAHTILHGFVAYLTQ